MSNEAKAREAVPVIQADREAAMRMLNHAFRNAPDDCTRDVEFDDIAAAFRDHRIANQRSDEAAEANQQHERNGEVERLQAERDFLLARAGHAGSCSFARGRWTGISSNALVATAFGIRSTEIPSDGDDLAACYRTVMRLPAHLRSDAVFAQLEEGERFVDRSYSTHVEWAKTAAEWPGREALTDPALRIGGE